MAASIRAGGWTFDGDRYLSKGSVKVRVVDFSWGWEATEIEKNGRTILNNVPTGGPLAKEVRKLLKNAILKSDTEMQEVLKEIQ